MLRLKIKYTFNHFVITAGENASYIKIITYKKMAFSEKA